MKKLIAILLCLVSVFALFSCDKTEAEPDEIDESIENTETADPEASKENHAPKQYFKLEQKGFGFYYEIYDKQGNVVLSKETSRPTEITMLGETIVDIEIGMGTGLQVHTYYDVEGNRFSEEYVYVAAASGNLVAYVDGESLNDRTLVVRDIFDREIFYKSFGLDFAPAVDTPIESAVFTENENELEVVYLSERPATPHSITLPIRYNFDDYGSIIRLYKKALEEIALYGKNLFDNIPLHLGLTDEREIEWCLAVSSAAFPYGLNCGYAIKDLNDDGIEELILLTEDYIVLAIFSMVDGDPILLGDYIPRGSCWIDSDGLLHLNGSGGADYTTNAVYQIADGGAELVLIIEFGTDGVEWVGDVAVTNYYKIINGERVESSEAEYEALGEQYGKYLGEFAGAEATKEVSGLTFTALYTEAEIAMEMYEAVLNNEVKVYDTEKDEYVYLKDYRSSTVGISLSETKNLGYVYIDANGDSINELFIDHAEVSVFWYHKGMICVGSPLILNDDLNHDGTFRWRTYTANLGHGESQFVFDGAELKTEVLWRIVNEGEPNAKYYIGKIQVEQEELLKYFEAHPKNLVEWSPLEASWQNKISYSEAITLAREYWERYDIEENGYHLEIGTNKSAPSSVYVVLIRRFVIDHYSTFDEIWIDKNTGDAIIPYAPEGKG